MVKGEKKIIILRQTNPIVYVKSKDYKKITIQIRHAQAKCPVVSWTTL